MIHLNKKILLVALLFSVVLLISSCEDQAKGRQLQTCSDLSGDPQECTQSGLDCEWVENNCVDIGSNDIIEEDPTEPSSGGSSSSSGGSSGITSVEGFVEKGGESWKGVSVVSVDSNGNQCMIEYAGSVYTVDKGTTKELSDGTIIGVTDTFVTGLVGGRDSCLINIQLSEDEIQQVEMQPKACKSVGCEVGQIICELDDGMKVCSSDGTSCNNGNALDGSNYGIGGSVIATCELIEEESIPIPKISGFMSINSDDIRLEMDLLDGDLNDFVLCYKNESNVLMLGEDEDEPLITANYQILKNTSIYPVYASDINDLEGAMFLYSFGSGNDVDSNIIQITDIDDIYNETDFRVVNTGYDYTAKKFIPEAASIFTFMDQSFTLNISVIHSQIQFKTINDNGGVLQDRLGNTISFKYPLICELKLNF